MRLDPHLTLYTKMISKWTKDLIVKSKMLKCPEENTSGTLKDIGIEEGFLGETPFTRQLVSGGPQKANKLMYSKGNNSIKRQPVGGRVSLPTTCLTED